MLLVWTFINILVLLYAKFEISIFCRKSPPSVDVMDFLVMLLHCHHSYGNYDGCRLQWQCLDRISNALTVSPIVVHSGSRTKCNNAEQNAII